MPQSSVPLPPTLPPQALPAAPWEPEEAARVAVVLQTALAQFWTLPLPVLWLLPALAGGGGVVLALAALAACIFAVVYAAAAGRAARREPDGVPRAQRLSGLALALAVLAYFLPLLFAQARVGLFDYALFFGPFVVAHLGLVHGLAVAHAYPNRQADPRLDEPRHEPGARGGRMVAQVRLNIRTRPITADDIRRAAAVGVCVTLCVTDIGGVLLLAMAMGRLDGLALAVVGVGAAFALLELIAARHIARRQWAWRLATGLSVFALLLCGGAALVAGALLLARPSAPSPLTLEALALLFALAMAHLAALLLPRLLANAARHDLEGGW